MSLRRVFALVLFATLPACRGCRGDHPFVPYRIDGGTSSGLVVVDASPTSTSVSEAGAFAREPSLIAPPHTTTWTIGKLALTAPPGGTFRRGLTWDLDGDGHDDALALVETGDEAVQEELFFYRGTAEGTTSPTRVSLIAEPPSVLDPRCTRVEQLTRVGKRSVSVEIGQACSSGAVRVDSERIVALAAWAGSLRPTLAFRVVDPPDAQTLSFEMEGTDIDGDGLDDVTLRISLEGGGAPFEPGPAVHAFFRWFDRPAGMSREPGEPEKSLHAIASLAAQRATKPKEAASALAAVAAGRFLFQAICAESSSRRVAPAPLASPLVCEAGHALEELGFAETRAHVTLGDAIRAIAALDAAELAPASHTPSRVAEATAWVTGLAPLVQATQIRAVGAVPLLGPQRSSWGALRFEPSGALLVRTPAGVVRVDPVNGDEMDAAGVLAWGSKVVSPGGDLRLEGVFVPCRGAALEATLARTADAGDALLVPVPVAIPVAARCTTGERDPIPTIPIAWGSGGLEVVVAGEPILVSPDGSKASVSFQPLGQPVTPGAPRSPDGSILVLPTSQGIAVRGARTRLLRAKELDHGYGELRDCVVSDDAARVACVRGGVAFVGVWPAP